MITSHIDRHNEKMSLDALESFVDQVNKQYTPIGIEHDPRIPPVGRVVSAHIEELEDGEFAVDGIAEMFEEGEETEFKDDEKEIPVREFTDDRLHIGYDRSYQNPDDQQLLKETRTLINGELSQQLKKATEPVSLLVIAGSFIAGGIAAGFLNKIGEDAWDSFKEKLIKLMNRKREEKKDYLLSFEFVVHKESHPLSLETILSNPTASEVNMFLQEGLEMLDGITPQFFKTRHHLRKIVFEYEKGKLRVIFGLRKDAVPLSVDLDIDAAAYRLVGKSRG
jgi:hypothetical protein